MAPQIFEQRNVIVIDDDKGIWQAYDSILGNTVEAEDSLSKQMGALLSSENSEDSTPSFNLKFAAQGQDGFALVKEAVYAGNPFSVAFIDIRMPPGWDGMETATRIREIDPDIEFVIVTAYTDRSREEIVKSVGAAEKLLFLRKPFDPEELYQMALSLSEKWQLARNGEQICAALAESEARFRTLVETTNDFVWEVDAEGRFVYCSPVCIAMYGYRPEELVGKLFYSIMNEDEAEQQQRLFQQMVQRAKKFQASERCCIRKDGVEVQIETGGVPIIDRNGAVSGFRGIDRDVTARIRIQQEKQRLEEQYHQAQKMEAIGTLAGGIAHDLNNLLTPILGYTEICRLSVGSNEELAANLKTVELSAKKAAGLIRQILTFSRKQVLTPEVFCLNDLISSFMKMLRRMIREDIELNLDLADQLWPINMDKNQLEQILINLVVNARDAVSKNGQITICTANKSIKAGAELVDTDKMPFFGDYVVLAVSDNGTGIDQANIKRIFDPFFTTKGVGHGTGLGLATVYGVTRQHKGHISIESSAGKGTTFFIYLPRTKEEAKSTMSYQLPVQGGTETILLVEDDNTVRDLAINMLQGLGYTVISAEGGLEALEQYKENTGRIDLVITDVVMPGLGGRDLIEQLRKDSPKLPVLFVSGYPQEMDSGENLDCSKTLFIQKPFNLRSLAEKIRQLCNGHADSNSE